MPLRHRSIHRVETPRICATLPKTRRRAMTTLAPADVKRLQNALPFWLSLGTIPVVLIAARFGGWALALMPAYTWGLYAILDLLTGLNEDNADPATPEQDLFWYRLITLIWFPIQITLLVGLIWYAPRSTLSTPEQIGLFCGMGIMSGSIGIVYAHELAHQKSRLERWLGDLLLASVLYSHFRSEHLRVHHLYVGTPRDPVTARYNEGFHRYFLRVLWHCPQSAWRAEAAMLARRGLPRRHLGKGKYERVLPRHSWNAAHRASNWLLINLQRHSDRHYKPDRRFPLLQTYPATDAPQLPYGYPVMTFAAMIPPVWKRIMNPRVRAWRRAYYPDIEDWKPYNKGKTPMPAGSP